MNSSKDFNDSFCSLSIEDQTDRDTILKSPLMMQVTTAQQPSLADELYEKLQNVQAFDIQSPTRKDTSNIL